MQTKDTHNRDSGYNSDLRTEVEALSRKFNELEMVLRNYLEEANDEKIKSNRRLQDTLFNLDEDNVPSLAFIRKKTFENGQSIAAIQVEATEEYAKIESLTQWKGSITDNNGELKVVNSLATFEQHVSDTYAKSATLTEFKEDTTKSIASIEQAVTKDSAKISLLVSTDSDGQNKVEGGVIVEAINNQSAVKIKADVLDIDVSNKVTIGDSIVINSGGSFSIAETIGDDGEILRTSWGSGYLSFEESADSSREYSAIYGPTGISLKLNGYLGTTIESGRITTDYIEVVDSISTTIFYCDKINGYKISFDENGYLKGVKE